VKGKKRNLLANGGEALSTLRTKEGKKKRKKKKVFSGIAKREGEKMEIFSFML